MTAEEIPLVAQELTETATLFLRREPIDQLFLEKYIRTLDEEGITGYQARLALRRACREQTFMPMPAELFAIIHRDAIPRAPADLSRLAIGTTAEHRWPTEEEMADNRRRLEEVLGRLVGAKEDTA